MSRVTTSVSQAEAGTEPTWERNQQSCVLAMEHRKICYLEKYTQNDLEMI